MRTPQDLPARAARPHLGRGKWWILGAVVVLIILLASLKSLATLYTDSLWFSSVNLHSVWSTLLAVKVGLFVSFGAIFFIGLWVSLLVGERLSGRMETVGPEDELVRRYQRAMRPHARRIYAIVAFVLALIVAAGTVGQWNNWILFTHAQSFGVKDPQFGMDVGFYVFKLPFLNFLVSWLLVALVVVLVVTAIFHYLNGGIRLQRPSPRVRPAVKVHLSVLLALIALVKAAGYVLARYQLDLSSNGYVNGAGYTDVHARLPALDILFFVSLFCAAILLYNIRLQGWTLPVLAIGIWAFVALAIGVIYPVVLQALVVTPAQSTKEIPYIQRNIAATRAAYGLKNVKVSSFQGSTSITASQVAADQATLNNIRLWDPDPSITLQSFQKLQGQAIRSYYSFPSVAVDRYTINGNMVPAVVGVRQINSDNLPSSSWVNTHLQYTHGQAAALALANQTTANGNPVFGISDVPSSSQKGLPKVKAPYSNIYFGLDQPGYVVANTKQAELDYQNKSGNNVSSHYKGTGGVRLGSFLTKAAFAIRLGDFNLLISSLVTPNSRIMFVRDVQAMAQKAAPFLSFDADPYAAIVNGQVDWILDGYVTTSQYPYAQNADTQQIPVGSGLPSSYNYVRDAVKVVINAYSGKMTFYAMDNDPILRAYESAFPHMFTPASKMSAALRAQLRYPEDLFSIQAAIYGRYHITNPSAFYNAGDAWNLSPTAGAGAPSNALAVTFVTNPQGQVVGGSLQRMSPVYQVLEPPGQNKQEFTISDVYVPYSQSANSQTLSAFIMATSDPDDYGKLHVYVTPPGQSVIGPTLADSEIQQNPTVSQDITYLDQHGSQVVLGNILPIPIDQSMLYVRPLYVESSGNPLPQLKYVIAVFGTRVYMETSVSAAVGEALGVSLNQSSSGASGPPTSTTPPTSSTTIQQAESLLKQAAQDYAQAKADLQSGDLGGYANEFNAAEQASSEAQQLLGGTSSGNGSTSTTSTTTTTTAPGSTPPAPSTPSISPAPGTQSSTPPSTTTSTSRPPSSHASTTTGALSGSARALAPEGGKSGSGTSVSGA